MSEKSTYEELERRVQELEKVESERKKAEKILKEIITKNSMSIQILDTKGCTLEVNSSYKSLFGSVPPSDYSIFNDIGLNVLRNYIAYNPLYQFAALGARQ